MKVSTHLAIVSFVFSLTYSEVIMAEENPGEDVNKINLKCHVEFVGGKNAILYHYHLPKTERDTFIKWLPNNYKGPKINNETTSVYKVNECVEIKDKFKYPGGNTLEATIELDR